MPGSLRASDRPQPLRARRRGVGRRRRSDRVHRRAGRAREGVVGRWPHRRHRRVPGDVRPPGVLDRACLARQGHNVIALPSRPLARLRSPDAAVGGLLAEFKTYTGVDPRQLLCRVGHARPQSLRVVVGVEAQWDTTLVREVFAVAIKSARRRGMPAVMFIGDDFQFEWGDWNAGFTAPAGTAHSRDAGRSGAALDHAVCRRSQRVVQSSTASPA